MVLIAISIFTKAGKALVTRQYVADMVRARLEGLIDSFPKLVVSDKSLRQHTFVETDSVRYVYQPLDNLYVVLITTKASNILEDLETLRLFSKVIPEYCRSNEESEILDKAFDLIFAFDEIVVLGYRENVNLAQIRTFTEMDSHEERVHNQIQIAQQRAAQNTMSEKAKEIRRAEKLKKSMGLKGAGTGTGGGLLSSSSSATGISSVTVAQQLGPSAVKDFIAGDNTINNSSSYFGAGGGSKLSVSVGGTGKSLKLGQQKTTASEDAFLKQLGDEDGKLAPKNESAASAGTEHPTSVGLPLSSAKKNVAPVHFTCSETLTAVITRAGAINTCHVVGSIGLRIGQPDYKTACIRVSNAVTTIPGFCDRDRKGNPGALIQVHPNLDKTVWQANSVLRPKSEQKPYPVGTDISVLKWTVQLADEAALPLALNCWPEQTAAGGCSVNIEYTLQRDDLSLDDVKITIPLPPGTAPVVSECTEGDYEYVRSRSQLVWTIAVVDARSSKTGTLEFSTPNGHNDHFYPVGVHFSSSHPFCRISVDGVEPMHGGDPIEHTSETRLQLDKYEIV